VDELPMVAAPGELDAEWLTAAIAPAPGARVVAARSVPIGDGKIGSNIRISLDWAPEAAGPPSVVAKLPSSDPASRTTGVSLGIYVRETRFYRELAHLVGARTPHCYAALFDESTSDFVLLLEDLAPAVTGDQLVGCSPAEAEAALAELALLHASHWCRPVPEFAPPGLPCTAAEIQPFYCMLLDGFCEKYAGRLSDEVLVTVRRFGEEMAAWGRAATAGGPTALLHGDYRLDNLLFSARRVAVVDWQMVASGPPMSDIAYFIGAGLLPADRRQHEEELLRGYHGRLVAAAPDAAGWTFDDCLRDYRLHSLGGIIMAVVASAMVGAGERSDEMFATMAERHAQHALDWDAFGLLGAVPH
jgi:hypothetical protein